MFTPSLKRDSTKSPSIYNEQNDPFSFPSKLPINTANAVMPENDLSNDARLQSVPLSKDPNYHKFANTIEKILQTFEYVTEWADITAFLAKLSRAFESFEVFDVIPEKTTVSKRLAQCLNPALPTGVHQKALSVYQQIFTQIGKANLDADLRLYATGLYSFIRYASTIAKDQAIEILKNDILPLVLTNHEHISSFLVAVLSGFEEDKSEVTLKCLTIFRKLQEEVSSEIFFSNIIYALLESPLDRENTLKCLIQYLPNLSNHSELERKIGNNVNNIVKGICFSLSDESLMVVRASLDLLIAKFPLNKKVLPNELILELMESSCQVVLRKDMSLNRRLYSWWLGSNEDIMYQKEYYLKYTVFWASEMFKEWFRCLTNKTMEFNHQAIPIRVLNSLMDKPVISQPLIDLILVTVIRSFIFRRIDTLNDSLKLDNRTDQAARTLFQSIDSRVILSQLITLLILRVPSLGINSGDLFSLDGVQVPDVSDFNMLSSDLDIDNTYTNSNYTPFNTKTNAQDYINDLEIFYTFINNYLSDDRDFRAKNLPSLSLVVLSIASYLAENSNLPEIQAITEILLGIATVLINKIPEEAMSLDFVVSGNQPFTENSLDIINLIKRIYNIDYYTYLFNADSIRELVKCFNDTALFQIETKLEIGGCLTTSSNIPLTLLKQVKKILYFSNNTDKSFQCACKLIKKLIKYEFISVKYEASIPTQIVATNQLDNCVFDSKTFKNSYILSLFKVATESKNFEQVKCAVETIISLIIYNHDISKKLMSETHSLDQFDLIQNNDVRLCSFSELIIENIWNFMNKDNCYEANIIFDHISAVFGDSLISEIISKNHLSNRKLSTNYIQLFTNFWNVQYYSKILKDLTMPPTQSNSHKINIKYFSLLTTTLSTIVNYFIKNSFYKGANQVSSLTVQANHKFNQSLYSEIHFCIHSGLSLESIIIPNILSIFEKKSITLLKSNPKVLNWLKPFSENIKNNLTLKPSGGHKSENQYQSIKNSNKITPSVSESVKSVNINPIDSSLLECHTLAFNAIMSGFSEKAISYVDVLAYILIPFLESTIPSNLLSMQALDNDILQTVGDCFIKNSKQKLSLQLTALEVLEYIVTIDKSCSLVRLSTDLLVTILNILIKIYYSVALSSIQIQSSDTFDLDTENNVLSICQNILLYIVNSSIDECRCKNCLSNITNNKIAHLNEEAVSNLLSSEFFSKAILYSFPAFIPSLHYNENSDSTLKHIWYDLVLALCRMQSKLLLKLQDKNFDFGKSFEPSFKFITLPLLNLVSQSLCISSDLILKQKSLFLENNYNVVLDNYSEKIIKLLVVYENLISICLRYPASVTSIDGIFSDTVHEHFLTFLWKNCNIIYPINNEDSLNLPKSFFSKHAIKLTTNYNLSLTYCMAILVRIWDNIVILNQNCTEINNNSEFNILTVNSLIISNQNKRFLLLKVCNQINISAQNLWGIDSSEIALALGDLFEHKNYCWIDMLFSPINFLKIVVDTEMLYTNGTVHTRSAVDNSLLNSGMVRDFKNDNSKSYRPSISNFNRNSNNSSSILSDTDAKVYNRIVKGYTNSQQLYASLNFLDILEGYPSTQDFNNQSQNDNSEAVHINLLFVSCLINKAAERIHNASEKSQNKQSSPNKQSNNLYPHNHDADNILGYSKFSNISDVGLLRLIELILEVRILNLMGHNHLGVLSCSDLSGDKPSKNRSYNKSPEVDNSFEINSIVKSTLLLFRVVDSSNVIEKTWMPFVFRICLSVFKVLGVFSKEKFATNLLHLTNSMLELENLLLKIIEKVFNELGKYISSSRWLTNIGNLPKNLEAFCSENYLKEIIDKKKYIDSVESCHDIYENQHQYFNRDFMDFNEIDANPKPSLNPSDSTILSIYRSSGIVFPLWYWNIDDSVEQLLFSINQNLFPNFLHFFSNSSLQNQLINLYLNNVMNPLSRILTINKHYTYLSNEVLEKFAYKSLKDLEAENEGLNIATDSISDSFKLSETLDSLSINEKLELLNQKSCNMHDQLVTLGLVEDSLNRNGLGEIDWRITDQPSRIYFLILSSLSSLYFYQDSFKLGNRAVWDFFQHSKFFSLKRIALAPHPAASKNKYAPLKHLRMPDYFISSAISSSIYMWKNLLRMSISGERDKILDIITKLGVSTGTTIFSNKAYESQQKAALLRRLSMLIWSCGKDHFLPNFPAIQEKIVELIKNNAYENVIIEVYLLLRVIMYKMGPDRISTMWPVIITEISKTLTSNLSFDPMSSDKVKFGSLNVLLACCKFLDLLLVYEVPEFLVHKSTFISDLNRSDDSFSVNSIFNTNKKLALPDSIIFESRNCLSPNSMRESNSEDYNHKSPTVDFKISDNSKISKSEFQPIFKKVFLNSGLLDQLANHFLTLSNFKRGGSTFGSSISRSNSPDNNIIGIPNNSLENNQISLNVSKNKSPGTIYSNSISSKTPKSFISVQSPSFKDLNKYKHKQAKFTSKSKDITFRRPLISETYIYSPLQLLPFLLDISLHDFKMVLQKSTPDLSYIESLFSQDLMTFYDISAVSSSVSSFNPDIFLNLKQNLNEKGDKNFYNDKNPYSSLFNFIQEDEGSF
ncbi:hypothetical protein BB561_001048 [Smittium simulii]|uniref:Uncharacterized protein n=1 Tax=Smittium simulii TaxID=133385 RepID=A0A2T9YWC4_9FUNG|nr:hypothetical protein BB561_001048 [Smittium simulii]